MTSSRWLKGLLSGRDVAALMLALTLALPLPPLPPLPLLLLPLLPLLLHPV